jgi:hypothetical protein
MTTESKDVDRPKSRRLLTVVLAIVTFIVTLGLGYWHYEKSQIKPVTRWNDLEIGMSELDVTLAYGRKPDCVGVDSKDEKQLVFHGQTECSTRLFFRRESNAKNQLVKICTPYFAPSYIDNYSFSVPQSEEKQVISNLGEPSFVSINQAGTTRLSSFENYNVAFAFENEQIVLYCVTKDMPVRFSDEHSG